MRILLDDHLYDHAMLEAAESLPEVPAFVLTRFNIPMPGAREKGGFGDDARFRQWCINRSKIFTEVCLPSLLSQTRRPTGWLLLFDETYLKETDRALKAIAQFDWIVPIIVPTSGPIANYRQYFAPKINERLSDTARHAVTIRLDNDDAISRTFVDSVVAYAQSALLRGAAAPFWISFPYGVQWDGSEVTLKLQNNNPFVSLVEEASRFRAGKATMAMSTNHGKVFVHGIVKTATARVPMWLQYTHAENVSNRKDARLLAFRDTREILGNFGLRL